MMLKNTVNNQDHQKGIDTREISKNNQNHLKTDRNHKRRLSQSLRSPVHSKAKRRQKQSISPDQDRNHKKSWSRSQQSPNDHRRHEVSSQVPINSLQKNSSLKRGQSWSLKSHNDHRRPKLSPHVPINSSQENSSLKRGRS